MDALINKITDALNRIAGGRQTVKKPVVVAIDGRCGAGKTTLADYLKEKKGWSVFHMDDFFLRPAQRTKKRFAQPGGNVDHERFREDILIPLRNGERVISFCPFDCHRQEFAEAVSVTVGEVNLVEGSYSCHPALWDAYDLRVFMDIAQAEQERRILKRNGQDGAALFRERWIPLEECYFDAYRIKERCDLCLQVSAMP